MGSRKPARRIREIVFILVLSIAWFLIGWIVRGYSQNSDIVLIDQARQLLQDEYPANVPDNQELVYAAIQGMLDRIKDPYAQLLEPAVGRAYLADIAGDSGTVGLAPQKLNGQIVIDQVFPEQAADRAGLKAGDIILSVDGMTFDESMTEARAAMLHMSGPVGTTAHFVVQRGNEVVKVDVPRQAKTLIVSRMLDDGIGYLFLSAFTQNAPQKFHAALQELLNQRPRALIWDLRDNRGGSTDAAQQILSDFIGDGVLFTVELNGQRQQPFASQSGGVALNIPLVMLVNSHTYSAAEAAAAAIQDRHRGTVIGAQTHGKSEIQTTLPLGDGSMLHYSIGKLLSPSGQWYEGRGVTPDVIVGDDRIDQKDAILESAIDYVRQSVLR
jgi:carboxyl-terminal processing protease